MPPDRVRRTPALRTLWGLALAAALACGGAFVAYEPAGHQRTAPVPAAGERVGSSGCFDCHDSFDGHVVDAPFHGDCESCHGPGQRHSFTARAVDIRFPGNDACISCHRIGARTLVDWPNGEHARADVLCSDCHTTHSREPAQLRAPDAVHRAVLPRAGDRTRACVGCHPAVAAQLELPSHHPVGEGMLGCGDCHDPHGGLRDALGARTATCTGCHQEIAGPWIHEHLPVEEDCSYCHTPHGSSLDALLIASEPAACTSCHSIATAGAVHDPFAFATRCSDCHAAVHGSSTDPVLRR